VVVRAQLTVAATALEAEDWPRVLVELLSVWREAPHPEVAAAIDAVSERAIDTIHAPIAPSPGGRHQLWERRAKSGEPAMVGWCCATLNGRFGEQVRRLELLRSHGDDPRLSAVVCRLIESAHVRAQPHNLESWDRLWALLVRCGGVLERVRQFPASWDDLRPEAFVAFVARLALALPVLEAVAVAPIDRDDAAACMWITEGAPWATKTRDRRVREESALLAAVYADPSANAPREVYGDWLQQHGDPRGELIAIQMAHAKNPDARFTGLEKSLLDEYRDRWRGPLPATATELVFRRGFVDSARNTGPVTEDPSWATFVRATGVPQSDHANVPLLTVVEELRDADIIQLARLTRPLAIESLAWKDTREVGIINKTVEAALDAFERIVVLPKLRRLELERSFRTAPADAISLHELSRILAAPWLARLATLRVRWPSGKIDMLVAAVAHLDLEKLEVELHVDSQSQLELSRDDSHRLGHLRTDMRWRSDDPGSSLLAAIERLPPDQLVTVQIPRAEDRAAWEHALRHQTRLERIYV
jgi:uncharacterized protein (TIGR02996 family)